MAEPTLTLKDMTQGAVSVLAIAGELDAKTAPQLKAKLDAIVAGGVVKIVCDCAGLKYISSAGIGVLNAALSACKAKGGDIALAGVSKQIKDTLDVMYFTKKVRLFQKIADAVNEL
ncbi:MAG TPA: STAS domain-containing protein [Spirochaetota bacterium]|nr:STAS domain-containing protein [Spirochaetota bacterium]HNT10442.1 STAS domain-containing protein [Spirochaetota bacterium]HNV45971.1 STAS domain-containing protein [Spirochaetota bacterium]HOS38680.1 STAS domain-containing protein [Spirochaetota bacterium]HPI22379.1 STAS domain-containing protein [Spirochaetota bacterium]